MGRIISGRRKRDSRAKLAMVILSVNTAESQRLFIHRIEVPMASTQHQKWASDTSCDRLRNKHQ